MDLLANFMGLVVLGGAGLMIMIGGAVLHASTGASAFPVHCSPDDRLTKFMQSGAERNVVESPDHCVVDVQYKMLRFDRASSRVSTQDGRRGMKAICNDLKLAFTISDDRERGGPAIEVVGHASMEYDNTNRCGTEIGAEIAALRKKIPPRYFALFNELEGYRYEAPPFDSDEIERHVCNLRIASQRAVDIIDQCMTTVRADRDRTLTFDRDAARLVTTSSDPEDRMSDKSRAEMCAKASPGDNCQRTVTLRLRLRPNTDGA